MKWKKYTILTSVEAEDLVSALLNELGIEGIEIDDNWMPNEEERDEMFISWAPELDPDEQPVFDGTARLSFYLREAGDEEGAAAAQAAGPAVDDSYTIHDRVWTPDEITELLAQVREGMDEIVGYADIGAGTIEESETADSDWRDKWKTFYKPLRMDDILILPSWESIPAEYAAETEAGTLHTVIMDPGTAFGTGTHETTRLCVDAMKDFIAPGDRLLDIGTGSGILGFCALKRGASSVTGTELDPACLTVIEENRKLNSYAEQDFRLLFGNILDDEALIREAGEDYDLITANILAPVIEALAAPGQADRFLKQGGIFITSGIIDTKEEDVLRAFAANPAWEYLRTDRLGSWVSVIVRRK